MIFIQFSNLTSTELQECKTNAKTIINFIINREVVLNVEIFD
jgi:hypothetical protein